MDPTAALAELRTLAYISQTILDGGNVGDWHATMQAFVDTFTGLDDWMSKGGFAPEQWMRNRESP